MKITLSAYAAVAFAVVAIATPIASPGDEGFPLAVRAKNPGTGSGSRPNRGHAAPSGRAGRTGRGRASGRPVATDSVDAPDFSSPFPSANVTEVAIQATKTKTTKSAATKTSKATKTTKAATTGTGADSGDSPSTPTGTDTAAPESTGAASGTGAPAASVTGTASTPSGTTAPGSGSGSGSGGKGMPAGSGTSVLAAAQTITGSFDGGMKIFDRGQSCTGQAEGGDADAVFILAAGASLSNVIIGPNQREGVHCQGGCTLTNVWWAAVCEDAFTIKLQDAGQTTTVKGGGAYGATDKVFQHNAAGTLSISDFVVDGFGKCYRSCGNCKNSSARHVIMDGITATDGTSTLVGINSNFGDTAKITNSVLTNVKAVCTTFKGVASGSEPSEIGSGADGKNCIYGADVVSN